MLNLNILNTQVLNAGDIAVVLASFGGNLIAFDQNVYAATASSTNLIAFNQNILLQTVLDAGTIIFINQNVNTILSASTVIAFNQNVQSANAFLAANGYDLAVYIGGTLVPRNQLCDSFTITRSENTAASCGFTLKTPVGVQDPESYLGKPLKVYITDNSGVYCVFTGWVDNPSLDIYNEKIRFSCTDRRETQINAMSYGAITPIGMFSKYVFGDPKDQADELNKRLTTVSSSFDFDAHGNPQLTSWAPKGTADFTLGASNIYLEAPKVTYSNRDKTVNTVNITVNYQHQRLHQQVINVTWSGYQEFLRDWFNVGKPSFPQRTTITSAATAASWALLTPIQFTPLWPAGGYGSVSWNPNSVVNTYAQRVVQVPLVAGIINGVANYTWPDGKFHYADTPVLDANGQPIYDVILSTITDTSLPLCRGAQWVAGKKFAQTVTELYTISMTSPQAISRYGIIDAHETINVTDPYNTAGWTGDKTLYNLNATGGTALNCTTNSAGYDIGSTFIGLDNVGTGTFFAGDQIQIAGDTSGAYYTILQDHTAPGGTLHIASPGLEAPLLAQTYIIELIPGVGSTLSNFFIDQKSLYPDLKTALNTIVKKGETTLKAAHRSTLVDFKRSIWPAVDLTHTVATTATQIAAKSKVASITHTIDIATREAFTDVQLKLSRSFGGDSQSDYVFQTPPYEDTSYIGTVKGLSLQTHVGQNPDFRVNPLAITWNGYIGDAYETTGSGLTRTTYPQSFKVDYPPIGPTLTGNRTITQNPPGINNGVTTDAAGYLAGVTSIILASGGTGALLQGDTITITGDTSLQTYVVQSDILDVSAGGVLSISPGLGATLSTATHAILSSPAGNQFIVAIPNDPLVVEFTL